MAVAKIKKEFLGVVIGFNGSALPLGQRNDIDDLAIIAQQSQNQRLLRLFENELPDVEALIQEKVETEIKARRNRKKVEPKAE
jgi:hypothetical protein